MSRELPYELDQYNLALQRLQQYGRTLAFGAAAPGDRGALRALRGG